MNSPTQPLHPSLTDKPAAPPLLCARRILDIEEKAAHHATGTADLTVRTVHEALKAAAFTEEEIIERMCARIKAADDAAADNGYMLDSNDCIAVLRGTWAGPMAMDKPEKPSKPGGGQSRWLQGAQWQVHARITMPVSGTGLTLALLHTAFSLPNGSYMLFVDATTDALKRVLCDPEFQTLLPVATITVLDGQIPGGIRALSVVDRLPVGTYDLFLELRNTGSRNNR